MSFGFNGQQQRSSISVSRTGGLPGFNAFMPSSRELSSFLTPHFSPPPTKTTSTVLAKSNVTQVPDVIKAARRNDVGALRSAVAREETPGTVAAVRDEFGGTPLHCAAMKGHRNTLVYLLSHGADPNARDGRGWTALHWCAYNGHLELVCHLLAAGADAGARDPANATALDWARRRGMTVVEEALANPGDAAVYAEERLREDPVAASDYEVSSDEEEEEEDVEVDGEGGDDDGDKQDEK